jgi:hypothetical protein
MKTATNPLVKSDGCDNIQDSHLASIEIIFKKKEQR